MFCDILCLYLLVDEESVHSFDVWGHESVFNPGPVLETQKININSFVHHFKRQKVVNFGLHMCLTYLTTLRTSS